ncbi:phosphate acyltransferase PlsX [uncultured Cohaesibacter sp.]|uniref:phosphate acyltransferase PlsX n=1 Tax=uncultured Cohaesibacter sp. TaxID=1002546 RepID=UPI00374A7AFD
MWFRITSGIEYSGMSETINISLDVMGGDHGPSVILDGADIALVRHPDIRYQLFGDKEIIENLLNDFPRVKQASTLYHCEVVIQMDERPSQALRRGRNKSSMWRSIEATRDHLSDVCVSAGNTGALMAMSKFCLRTMADIERPAIAAIWPTLRGESIVLDVGATIGADAQQLVDFSLLGGAMARSLFGIDRPTIGLLNIGEEDVKGLDEVKEAGRMLRDFKFPQFEYKGFVEGDDLGTGAVDVVVTEGFAGNIALKTAEGTAKQLAEYLYSAMSRTWMARIGYMFARSAFSRLREKMDPRKVNGGVFLGLNGIVIKSHGGADGEGFAAAIGLGYDMVKNGLTEKIEQDLSIYHKNRFEADEENA